MSHIQNDRFEEAVKEREDELESQAEQMFDKVFEEKLKIHKDPDHARNAAENDILAFIFQE